MKLSNFYIIFVLSLITTSLSAQTEEDISETSFSIYDNDGSQETFKINYCIGDMDNDDIPDTLAYDIERASLLFSLSSQDFNPFSIVYENIGNFTTITAGTGGFDITASHMRAFNYESYIYDSENKRFQLAYISHENYGNAANDGSGSFYLDLIEGEYEGYMNFYDYENDTLGSSPYINMHIDNDPVYLDDEERTYYMPDETFLRECMEKYTPYYSDTIKFLGYDIDYDFWSLIGEKDGEPYSVTCGDLDSLNRGDIISLKLGTFYFQEYGDKSIFHVRTAGYESTKIKEGKLSQFYRENKKEINYHNIPNGYSYSVVSPMDIDYFLANSTDKTLLKHFKKPGSLEIVYSDSSEEDISDMQLGSDNNYFVTVSNKYKEKETLLCKLILSLNGYITDYYLFDKKTGTYKPW